MQQETSGGPKKEMGIYICKNTSLRQLCEREGFEGKSERGRATAWREGIGHGWADLLSHCAQLPPFPS